MRKIFFLIIFVSTTVFAQEIKFTGYGSFGYKFIDRLRIIEYNQETYFEGKFQAEIEINKQIEAQLDFRANSDDQQAKLREVSAKFSYLDFLTFEGGHVKRPFGSEYLVSSDDLISVERSYLTEISEELGYSGRSTGIMAYHKAKKDEAHSYYLFLYKNNNLQNGIVGRYVHHINDLEIGGNYFLLNTGGDYPIVSHAFAANIMYDKKDFSAELELMLLQDPVEGIRRRLQNLDDVVFGWGGRFTSILEINTNGKIIEEIEPFILLSYYQPDTKVVAQHTFQTLLGINFYFDKDVRLRLNGDALFTRNEFNNTYSTHDSRFIVEVQVRY